MRKFLSVLSAVVLGLSLTWGLAQGEEKEAPKEAAKGATIELALCLDVSNSMDGLIGSAKTRLWDIVNEMAKARPTPTLKVALYSFGHTGYDAKKGWVRQDLDFTTDLDKVNEKLFGLTTNGGTEYVARVCHAATEDLKWSADSKALKIIFVCGNEPANQDPMMKLDAVAEKAVRKGIVINTIYCGNAASSEALGWKGFADLAEGRYASIDQQRGTVAVATPFDKQITELGVKLNQTFVFYGKEGEALKSNQVRQDANAAAQAPAAAAQRALSKGTGLYKFEADLVQKLQDDKNFDVKKVADGELPENLRKMNAEDREKFVKERLDERVTLQKQLAELSKKREEYVKEQEKKNAKPGEKTLDEAIKGVIREQAKQRGIAIPE